MEEKEKLIEDALSVLPEGLVRNNVRKILEKRIEKIERKEDFVELLRIVVPPVFLPKVLSVINGDKRVIWVPEAKVFLDDICSSIPPLVRTFVKRKVAKKSIEIAKKESKVIDKKIVLQAALEVLNEAPSRVRNKVKKILAKSGGVEV